MHVWNHCHACGVQPIVGRRFECLSCPAGPDNDLCEACFRAFERGQVEHPAPGGYAQHAGRHEHVFRAREGVSSDRCQQWLAPPLATASAPAVPDRFVVRPEFRVGRDSFFGAYGCVVAAEDGGQALLLTALHVMDELIKRVGLDCSVHNHAYSGEELPGLVSEVGLYDVFAENWMPAELGVAPAMLTLPEARLGEEEPLSDRDLAAFRVSAAARVVAGRLASATPRPGDPVWLAARRPGTSLRTSEAVVVEATERSFIFRFADPQEGAPYTSGAPLIDRDGAVVAINVGAGRFAGQRFGHGNHVGSIRLHLERGAAASLPSDRSGLA